MFVYLKYFTSGIFTYSYEPINKGNLQFKVNFYMVFNIDFNRF